VTVDGETYVIVDIGMRMLTPRELFLCQGFPDDYQIQFQMRVKVKGKWLKKWLTKKAQTRLVGNSVPPHVAAALVRANLPDLALRYAA
jgi:DNA (cytosine-5)-methyltransferase 1